MLFLIVELGAIEIPIFILSSVLPPQIEVEFATDKDSFGGNCNENVKQYVFH